MPTSSLQSRVAAPDAVAIADDAQTTPSAFVPAEPADLNVIVGVPVVELYHARSAKRVVAKYFTRRTRFDATASQSSCSRPL
jgi:hypothetical protein